MGRGRHRPASRSSNSNNQRDKRNTNDNTLSANSSIPETPATVAHPARAGATSTASELPSGRSSSPPSGSASVEHGLLLDDLWSKAANDLQACAATIERPFVRETSLIIEHLLRQHEIELRKRQQVSAVASNNTITSFRNFRRQIRAQQLVGICHVRSVLQLAMASVRASVSFSLAERPAIALSAACYEPQDVSGLSLLCDQFCRLIECSARALGRQIRLPLPAVSDDVQSEEQVVPFLETLLWDIFPRVRLQPKFNDIRGDMMRANLSIQKRADAAVVCIVCQLPKFYSCVCSSAEVVSCVPLTFLRALNTLLAGRELSLDNIAEYSLFANMFEFLLPICKYGVTMVHDAALTTTAQRLAVNCVGHLLRSMSPSGLSGSVLLADGRLRYFQRRAFELLIEQVVANLRSRRTDIERWVGGAWQSDCSYAFVSANYREPVDSSRSVLCSSLHALAALLPDLTPASGPKISSQRGSLLAVDDGHVLFLFDAVRECLVLRNDDAASNDDEAKLRTHALTVLIVLLKTFPAITFARWKELLPLHRTERPERTKTGRVVIPFIDLLRLLRLETSIQVQANILVALATVLEMKSAQNYMRMATEDPKASPTSIQTLAPSFSSVLRTLHLELGEIAFNLASYAGVQRSTNLRSTSHAYFRIFHTLCANTPYVKLRPGLLVQIFSFALLLIRRDDEQKCAALKLISAFFTRSPTPAELRPIGGARVLDGRNVPLEELKVMLASKHDDSIVETVFEACGSGPISARVDALLCVASFFAQPAYCSALLSAADNGGTSQYIAKLRSILESGLSDDEESAEIKTASLRILGGLCTWDVEPARALTEDLRLFESNPANAESCGGWSDLLSRLGRHVHASVRAATSDVIAQASQIPGKSASFVQRFSMLVLEHSRDPIASVRSAGIKALGALCVLAVRLHDDASLRFQKTCAKAMKRVTSDDAPLGRLRAVAAVGDIAQELMNLPSANATTLLLLLPHVAVKASSDPDARVRAQGFRALAGLSCCLLRNNQHDQPVLLGSSTQIPKWVLKAVVLIQSALRADRGTNPNPKECWNACAAASALLAFPHVIAGSSLPAAVRPDLHGLLQALLSAACNMQNFKVRFSACDALCKGFITAKQIGQVECELSQDGFCESVRALFGSTGFLPKLWGQLESAVENFATGTGSDFTQQRFREQLEDALANAVIELSELTVHVMDAVSVEERERIIHTPLNSTMDLLEKRRAREETMQRFQRPADSSSADGEQNADHLLPTTTQFAMMSGKPVRTRAGQAIERLLSFSTQTL